MALFPPFPTVRKIQEQYTTPRPPPAWPPCTLCNDGSGGGGLVAMMKQKTALAEELQQLKDLAAKDDKAAQVPSIGPLGGGGGLAVWGGTRVFWRIGEPNCITVRMSFPFPRGFYLLYVECPGL